MTKSKVALSVLVCLAALQVGADEKAVTENGDVVILKDDGTWYYEDARPVETLAIPRNETPFERASDSNFAVKSVNNDAMVYIDPRSWAFSKGVNNKDAEFEFVLKGKDLYGMLITEKIPLEMEGLSDIAFEVARSTAPNMRIITREYRNVNGVELVYMEMAGSMFGTDFIYFGQYFSDESGSTQLIAYTSTALADSYRDDIQVFLNGFSVQ